MPIAPSLKHAVAVALALSVVSAGSVLPSPAVAKDDRPADQATRDTALLTARAKLIVAVKRRDMAAVLRYFTPTVKLSFGGDAGHGALKKFLREDKSLWANLQWVLENGGRFNKSGSFTAPWTFFAHVKGIDDTEAGVLIARRVNIRSKPAASSAVLATRSFGVLRLVDGGKDQDRWIKIALADKRIGYVHRRFIRLVVDYRATWTKKGGRWMISSFVAGD